MVLTYAANLRRMSEAGGAVEKKENPWGWLPNIELSLADQERLLSALPVQGSQCSRRIALIEALSSTFSHASVDVSEWLGTVNQWSSTQAAPVELKVDVGDWLTGVDQWTADIPDGDGECHHDLLCTLSGNKRFAAMEHFLGARERYPALLSSLPGGDALLDSNVPTEFQKRDEKLRNLGLSDYSIGSVIRSITITKRGPYWGIIIRELRRHQFQSLAHCLSFAPLAHAICPWKSVVGCSQVNFR